MSRPKIIFKVKPPPIIKFVEIKPRFELSCDIKETIHADIRARLAKFKSYNVKIDTYSSSKSKSK